MSMRQPIVSVLGHVDHGKTSLLDRIRGTFVAERESGRITQHIGATEVPLPEIVRICGTMASATTFKVPGLLFIDTPGHRAFSSLRARGGSLADLAVLVVDLNEGFKPQTIESLHILRKGKTPFVVAANKVDLVQGWTKCDEQVFRMALEQQHSRAREKLDERLYDLIGALATHGFSADRYDRVSDFQRNLAIIPTSALTGVGIPDLLLVLSGLAQRFLEARLDVEEEGPGAGTVLEVKEEKGLGMTLDVIIYRGTFTTSDLLVVGTPNGPRHSRIRALLKPRPMDEIRSPRDRFSNVDRVVAAAGIKVVPHELTDIVAGAPVRAASAEQLSQVLTELEEELTPHIEVREDGICIKADAVGSLEALAAELDEAGYGVSSGTVGDISRRDIVPVSTIEDPLRRIVLGFTTRVLPEAKTEAEAVGVTILTSDILYRLVEEFVAWRLQASKDLDVARRLAYNFPGKVLLLPDHTFRVKGPAIVGVRVLAGRVRSDQRLIRSKDGQDIGFVKSMRKGEETVKEAMAGDELALAIDGPTVGRQIKEGDTLLVNLAETEFIHLAKLPLNPDEREVLEEVASIKRAERPFWGR